MHRALTCSCSASVLQLVGIHIEPICSCLLLLQLDGAAPEGHPDSAAFSNGSSSVPSARTRARAAAAAASAIAGSNGTASNGSSSNGVTSIRRLRSSSRTRAAASSSSSSSSSSSVAAAAAAALAAAAAEHQQQHHQHRQQDVSSSSDNSSNTQQQQQHMASTPTAAAEHTPSPSNSSSSSTSTSRVRVAVSPQSSDSEDDTEEATDKELQAEFHESNCCQDVLDIVADELPRFAPFHTVTALNRLAKLARGMNWEARKEVLAESSFVKLLEKLQAQVDAGRLNAFQLSTSLYSCAALQVGLLHDLSAL
jgi:hypothetical protein